MISEKNFLIILDSFSKLFSMLKLYLIVLVQETWAFALDRQHAGCHLLLFLTIVSYSPQMKIKNLWTYFLSITSVLLAIISLSNKWFLKEWNSKLGIIQSRLWEDMDKPLEPDFSLNIIIQQLLSGNSISYYGPPMFVYKHCKGCRKKDGDERFVI